MAVVRKRDVPTQAPVEGSNGQVSEFATRFPSVMEMLASVRYPDGELRRTSTFTVFIEDGVCKVCLNDRDNGLTGWASGPSVLEALESLEAMLAKDTVVWRAAGADVRKGRRRS